MTPLIEKHFGQLLFNLRLKFKEPVVVDGETWNEAYVGDTGPVKEAYKAAYFEAGPHGESRHFLIRWFIEDSGMEWLRNVPERHLEVVSELGEM